MQLDTKFFAQVFWLNEKNTKGKNGYGHDERVLAIGQQLGCDFVGLQETRRPGNTRFSAAGYQVFCSGILA